MASNNSLTLSDKLILITLELLIPKQEWVSITRLHIANVSGVSVRTVSTSLRRLRERGIISIQRPNSGIHYTYTLHKDKAPQVDESSLLALLL